MDNAFARSSATQVSKLEVFLRCVLHELRFAHAALLISTTHMRAWR